MKNFFKDFWLRIVIRGTHYSERNRRLDALYWVCDPWSMQTPREIYRFDETNRIIKSNFGQTNRMLEVGCGEGHQSERLLEICNTLYGIDVSHRAVIRAKDRCKHGIFGKGDIFTAKILEGTDHFDLVVACEVLYYMQNIPAVLSRMSKIGSACLVTYYAGQAEKLDGFFAKISNSQKTTFRFQETVWKAVWWRGDLPV